ncbi:DUF6082 family protein [Streptomyces noursei]|uniref:DUF6082 family protein n=1 Tax=Streptomyces noursei TaxID=1971 RepID=UPI0023B7B3B1|nr:DUF6082 family protein [Streptomyces noursei]
MQISLVIAVVAVVVVGIARLVQAERHHRRRVALHTTSLLQAWTFEATSTQEWRSLWTPPDEFTATHARIHHVEHRIRLLSTAYQVGQFDDQAVRFEARRLLECAAARAYWDEHHSRLVGEARTRRQRAFMALLDAAWEATSRELV